MSFSCAFPAPYKPVLPWYPSNLYETLVQLLSLEGLTAFQKTFLPAALAGVGHLSLRSQQAAVLPHCPLEQYKLQHPAPPSLP